MIVKFSIDYRTRWGQKICVTGSTKGLGKWNLEKAVPLSHAFDERWEKSIDIDAKDTDDIEYKYFLQDENQQYVEWEYGENRLIPKADIKFEEIQLRDSWRPRLDEQNVWETSPFKKAFFKSPPAKKLNTPKSSEGVYLKFNLRISRVKPGMKVAVVGDHASLGNWDEKKALVMDQSTDYRWSAYAKLDASVTYVQYKYVIYDPKTEKVVWWEYGENRSWTSLPSKKKSRLFIQSDIHFRFPIGNWRGAGVAIPVFSLRSKQGTGVGEFLDLKLLVGWAVKTGMKIIQVLPVNDTVARHNWIDSYPYAAISVFALHPIYINLDAIGKLKDKKEQKYFEEQRNKLNVLDEIDYEEVMRVKSRFFKLKYDETKDEFLSSKEFKNFFNQNQHWLVPYAVFSRLRDLNQTPDFTRWKKYKTITQKQLDQLASPKNDDYDHFAVHYFIQYHLDKQLKEASEYARNHGVVLKGDIPIGIYRNSVDAWIAPHLYNMDGQTGAPPDEFSNTGQNWGFPTYNWEEMAKDNFQWWKNRLVKLSDYFDIFRIDHILGFFRIWEIPLHAVDGLLGRFRPSLSFSREELVSWGISMDVERMCRPYIREYMLHEIFGDLASQVKKEYLDEKSPGIFSLKEEVNTQRKVKAYLDANPEIPVSERKFLESGLWQLINEVIFLESSDADQYDPRVGFQTTYSFRDLDGYLQHVLNNLYNHYFYKRHNAFWREKAMEKLPPLKNATDMLICGEDLGMVPECVPGVMNDLQILSLAVQRMPNDNSKEFWHPSDTSYLSVTTTSSHDTSTLRGWWEEDRGVTQRFYNHILGNWGDAPQFCETWLVADIIKQHLYSPSMLAIFPIQDWIGMDARLRKENPHFERINIPAIVPHYWKYRFHLDLEDLLKENDFNAYIFEMINNSGRLE